MFGCPAQRAAAHNVDPLLAPAGTGVDAGQPKTKCRQPLPAAREQPASRLLLLSVPRMIGLQIQARQPSAVDRGPQPERTRQPAHRSQIVNHRQRVQEHRPERGRNRETQPAPNTCVSRSNCPQACIASHLAPNRVSVAQSASRLVRIAISDARAVDGAAHTSGGNTGTRATSATTCPA